MTFETVSLEASGLAFTADVAGPADGDVVLLLHGFPQTRHTWRAELRALGAAGLRACAPDQRGYSAGARPEGIDAYRSERLVADVLAIADALGALRFHLVGHDWGGHLAWITAAQNPRRVRTLSVISRPHPAAFASAIAGDPEQTTRSRHHRAFQSADATDELLADGAARLRATLGRQGVPGEDVDAYLATLGERAALDAAIHWYRAAASSSIAAADVPVVTVPTLYVWGDADATVRTAGSGPVAAQTLALARTVSINPPEPDPWSGSLLAGAEFDRGNTFEDEANVELRVHRRTEAARIFFGAAYDGERSKDLSTGVSNTSDRNLKGRLTYDYFLTKKLFAYATSMAEKDGPSDLELRFIGGGGLGYDWFESARTKLTLRAGLSWISESYGDSSQDHSDPGILAEWLFERQLGDALRFFHDGKWLPSIGGGSDMLFQTQTGLRFDLTASLFAEAKYVWDWDSEPAEGKSQEDIDYIFSLGWKF